MQNVSAAYRAAYQQATSLHALPRVIFEWNHNRMSSTVTPSNGGDTTDDINFPISSISNAVRGTAGLIKARVGESRTFRMRQNSAPQYRVVGPRSNYKYWSSPNESTGAMGITNVTPQVVYGSAVSANKIVIGVENSWAQPTSWTVSVSYDGTNWFQAASNTTASINSAGQIILYFQSGNTWTGTLNRGGAVNIRGVRFNVTALSQPNAHANIIEVSARLEKDLSESVMSITTTRTTDEPSLIFPVGQINSNTATVSLDNTNKHFDRDNTASPYFGLLDNNVKITIEYGTDVSQYGGGMEYVHQGVYYVDGWNADIETSTVEVPASDFSKFFQNMQMHPVLFENRTPAQIIAEILSSVGYNNYALDVANTESQPRIPFVWFTAEDNVWEAIQSICSSVQGTVYSDERGVIRFVSRDKVFENITRPADFAVSADNNGSTLANLESLDNNFNVEANKVIINYRPLVANSRKNAVDREVEVETEWNQTRRVNRREYDTIPIDSVLWKPENTVTLRAAQLITSMTATDNAIIISADRAVSWPWVGTVNIEGEIMTYRGKQYRWWKNGVQQDTVVLNKEQQTNIDDMQSDLATRHKNYYTGRLVDVKRGQQGTAPAPHSGTITGWQIRTKDNANNIATRPARMTHQGSEMVLWGQSTDDNNTYTYAHRGYFSDDYRVYGTRLRFANTTYKQGTAGLFWQLQSDNRQGYYVEINLTSHAAAMGGSIGEIRVYRMMADGNRRALPSATANAFGWSMPVVRNQWIDIDVTSSGTGTYNVYVNGILRTSFRDPSGTLPKGTWGPFVRGFSVAAFEYFYVTNTGDNTTPNIDASSFQHKVTGGFVSGWADREVSRRNVKTVNWFFDEFGPWVHEMRKFQVEFDKVPALDAHVYLSNTWDAYLLEGNRTAFDAEFWLANSGRDNAVINGDDPTVYLGGGDIKQQLLLYGQLITEDEESSVNTEQDGIYKSNVDQNENSITYTNEFAIRKRGVVELSVDSKWIQSRSQAEALGKWITDHWSEPVDNISVTGYFNPAIQLGDIVSVQYTERNMNPANHRYHVVGINSEFNEGIGMSLTLRRIR